MTSELVPAEAARRQELIKKRKNYELDMLKIRTRARKDSVLREAYGVVSDDYTEFDADQIARALELAVPEQARASWKYDGQRMKFDVQFFSNIEPKHAVAGEFFKAGVSIRSDDTGGGSIVVQAGIWQNLCLNFVIIDHDKAQAIRLYHRGSTAKLAADFKEAFALSLDKISHFTGVWGYACEDKCEVPALALAAAQGILTRDEAQSWVGRPAREVLAGLYNGILERELVPLPRRDRVQTVTALLKMWELDQSSATQVAPVTRAAVVNGITRYAHEVNQSPFLEAAIEEAAGALLFGPREGANPAPLPFLPITI